MRNMIWKAFSKKLFGETYQRITRSVGICLIVFLGLYMGNIRVLIAPSILYMMVTSFTAGVMWQSLSSEENARYMKNLMMMPLERRGFVVSYVAALGVYTVFTKTAVLLAVLLAVSVQSKMEVLGSILCMGNAVFMTAAVFSLRKYWYAAGLWGAGVLAGILYCGNGLGLLAVLAANSVLSCFLLLCADGYTFIASPKGVAYGVPFGYTFQIKGRRHKSKVTEYKHGFMWRYLFRYLNSHKNYWMNTAVMWCVACALPLFWGQMDRKFVIPIGFAILSLNTPICILLSCDPALERAVRFLPGQRKAFCVPYCLFIFICNLIADFIFLLSFQIQAGGVTVFMAVMAVFFALQSAIFSVLLEWFYPIRGWKIESDLWHHPRKYVVPGIMLLLAGAVGAAPRIVFVLVGLL